MSADFFSEKFFQIPFFFWKILNFFLKKKIYMITEHFLLLTFFENLNFEYNGILFYLFFSQNHRPPF